MRLTSWEAHQVAALANKVKYLDARWYVTEDKNGNPIVVNGDAHWLDDDDLAQLAIWNI